MSLTLIIWLLLFAGLAVAAFTRPVYAVSLYMLTFFLSPPFWWWGDPIEGYRWNFISGFILLGATMITPTPLITNRTKSFFVVSFAIIVNAALVNFFIAGNSEESAESFSLVLKFFLLAYMLFRTIRSKEDLQIVMLSILLGAAYIGFEITINDRGDLVGNRLEGVGAPGATTANHFASLMVTIMPMLAPFFLAGRTWVKILVVCLAPFIVNVVLLCNSRGAFLAAIISGIIFVCCAPKSIRSKAWKTAVFAVFGVFMLLGDARIIDRFVSTFTSTEERDQSAQSRLDFWEAGMGMIADYPLGGGGSGFKKVHGVKYLRASGVSDVARAVHNGYLNEACEWGIQGLMIRLFWFYAVARMVWDGLRRHQDNSTDLFLLLTQIAMLSSLSAFLVTYIFGDQNSSEWGYWIVALILVVARLTTDITKEEGAEEDELAASEQSRRDDVSVA